MVQQLTEGIVYSTMQLVILVTNQDTFHACIGVRKQSTLTISVLIQMLADAIMMSSLTAF